jgi:hypothetical protein
MRSRWRWLWVSVALTILVGAWVAWRSRQPEFQFLAGRNLLYPVQEGPEWDSTYTGFPPQARSEAVYGFKEDSAHVIQMADRQLLAAGWQREVFQDAVVDDHDKVLDVEAVIYREPGGLGRIVSISRDCSVPSTGTTDLITVGRYRPGWTGVSICWPNQKQDWQTRARRWINKVFLGHP